MINYDNWKLSKWRAPAPPDGLATEPDHRVANLARQENIEIMLLGSFGMKIKTIAAFSHVSEASVRYRLKRMGIRIQDYREGKGPIAAMVLGRCTNMAAKKAIAMVRQHKELA